MLQGAALLYKISENKSYRTDAQHIVKSAIDLIIELACGFRNLRIAINVNVI